MYKSKGEFGREMVLIFLAIAALLAIFYLVATHCYG